MSGIIDNFELGLAGIADSAERLVGLQAHHAATLYAAQEASGDSAKRAQLEASATAAEDSGALGQAARTTVDQVGAGLGKFGLGTLTAIEWGLGVAAGVILLVAAHKAWKAVT